MLLGFIICEPSLIDNVLVNCGYVTNYPKLTGLQHTFMTSQFPQFRNLDEVQQGPLLQAFSQVAVISKTAWAGSSSKLTLMWLLAGLGSSQVVGLGPQFLMSCWQEASLRSLPHGPIYRASCTWQLASSGEQARGQQRLPAKESMLARHSHGVLEPNLGNESHHFYYILLVTRSNLHSRGGDYTRV